MDETTDHQDRTATAERVTLGRTGVPRSKSGAARPARTREATVTSGADPTSQVRPGADAWAHDAGEVGVVLCHGFTGSPASLMPWASALAGAGMTVRLPRLPGHGTTWQDMQQTRWPDWYAEVEDAFLDLRGRCSSVFVMGLSMGGCLALRLAEVHGDAVSGLVLVNPSVMSEKRALALLPVLHRVVPSLRGISNDIALADQDEVAYARVPLRALHSLTQLWRLTRNDLSRVTQPLLLFRSAVDHVVEASNARLVLSGVNSVDVEERVLANSYHVATLDHDAAVIIDGSMAFVSRLTSAHDGSRE
jgi:carboxylesterase